MSDCTWRVHIVVPASSRAEADALACSISGDDPTRASTFVVPLSATGEAPATHYGCCGAFDEQERGRLLCELPVFPIATQWALVHMADSTHASDSAPDADARRGSAWNWQRTLDLMGLHEVRAGA